MKNNFVQTIPYGRSLSKAKIKINDKGEVVIRGKENVWHIKNLNAAIRQQLFHVLFYYKDTMLLFKPVGIKHSGQISEIENTAQKIESLLKSVEIIRNIKILKDKVTEFDKNLQGMKDILTEKQKRNIHIVKRVLIRAEKLLDERERCEKIITAAVFNWVIVYSFLDLDTNKFKDIKWNQFFHQVKKLRTIYVNPYGARTQSPEIRFLQYNFYSLVNVKNDIDQSKKRLWKALEKVVPIYPGKLPIRIDEKIFFIKDGKILFKVGE